jgi:hypothetical protein
MKGTRIKIKVEFEDYEVTSKSVTEPIQIEDGSFVVEMPEALETDIDECEQALLRANFPALRNAISKHLERASKKNRKDKR